MCGTIITIAFGVAHHAESRYHVHRAPRGTKPVSQAFFTALDAVPEASRAAVAKAAQAMIRDELKGRKEKMKVTAAKEKARKPAPATKPKAAAPTKPTKAVEAKKPAKMAEAAKANGADPVAAPAKRRPRKTADAPTEI